MSLRQEIDLTRDGTAEMTRWCIIIALHQGFGVGSERLRKLENRAGSGPTKPQVSRKTSRKVTA